MVRPIRCKSATAAWLAAAALALAAPRAGAQNLVPNPEFDVDGKPWDTGGAGSSLGWRGDHDHSGCPPPVSGAAVGINAAAAAGVEFGYSACAVGIEGGATYSFGADLRFTSGQARTGSAHLVVVWLSSSDCSGLSADFDETAPLDSAIAGTWVRLADDEVVAPGGAESAGFVVRLLKNEAGGSLEVEFDGAYLRRAPGFLFGDGVERGSTCHWNVAVP